MTVFKSSDDLKNNLPETFQDVLTVFKSSDDLKKNLKEMLKEIVAASELLHGGFSDWRKRLIEKNQSFQKNVNSFLTQYFAKRNNSKLFFLEILFE